MVKSLTTNVGDTEDVRSIPGLVRPPGGGMIPIMSRDVRHGTVCYIKTGIKCISQLGGGGEALRTVLLQSQNREGLTQTSLPDSKIRTLGG